MELMNVDIAFFQETKLTGSIYSRYTSEYSVIATNAPSSHQGGVALCWKAKNESFEIKGTKVWRHNVMTFQLVMSSD